VERILYLLPARFRKIKFIGFKKFFFILFIICVLVNIPGMLLLEPAFADVQLDRNTLYRVWYFGPTTFSNSFIGTVLKGIGFMFRDILPMIFKIIINSLSVYLVRKYVRNKQRITAANSQMVNFDRQQTYIGLVMSTFSLLEHILYIIAVFLFFIRYFDLCTLFYAFALLFIAIKHLLIFFILLGFNNLFRKEIKYIFKRNPNASSSSL
jgi:hypothetical protein